MAQGYGSDTWCMGSMQTGRYARGRTLVAQALYRRFTTPRGTLRGGADEEVYGLDLAAYVGRVATATALASLPSMIPAEALKDDRVQSVVARVTISNTAPDGSVTIDATLDVQLVGEDQTFPLTLRITAVTVEILQLPSE